MPSNNNLITINTLEDSTAGLVSRAESRLIIMLLAHCPLCGQWY